MKAAGTETPSASRRRGGSRGRERKGNRGRSAAAASVADQHFDNAREAAAATLPALSSRDRAPGRPFPSGRPIFFLQQCDACGRGSRPNAGGGWRPAGSAERTRRRENVGDAGGDVRPAPPIRLSAGRRLARPALRSVVAPEVPFEHVAADATVVDPPDGVELAEAEAPLALTGERGHRRPPSQVPCPFPRWSFSALVDLG